MDSSINSISGRMRRIFDANFFVPHSSVALRFDVPHPELRAPLLRFAEAEIRVTVRRRAPTPSLLGTALLQWSEEVRQRFFRRARFRSRDNSAACAAYGRLSTDELQRINLRQAWAGWRVIPRSLSGFIPDRPLKVLDLCSGLGDSTDVLAHYLPLGSQVVGLEFNRRFVLAASGRDYRHRSGHSALVRFQVQSVLEPFANVDGTEFTGSSVDLVHCIGALSINFTPLQTFRVILNAKSVLKPGGALIIDMEKCGRERQALLNGIRNAGFVHLRSQSSCKLDRSAQECFVYKSGV